MDAFQSKSLVSKKQNNTWGSFFVPTKSGHIFLVWGHRAKSFGACQIKNITAADATQGKKPRWLGGTDGLFLFDLTFSGSGLGALCYGSCMPEKLPPTNTLNPILKPLYKWAVACSHHSECLFNKYMDGLLYMPAAWINLAVSYASGTQRRMERK